MNALRTLFLLAAGLSVACCGPRPPIQRRVINPFMTGIQCLMSDNSPVLDYSDYGCYCGLGGSGTPVDDLDRCCQEHDKCFDYAMQLDACWSIFDSLYTRIYSYDCDEANKTITCLEIENGECEQFICECDRKAAECFAKLPYNDEYHNLPSDRCH